MASTNPRIRAIELEASRRAAADGQTSKAERFDIRNQLRSRAGLGAEKRKRGGAAGVWDRNKQVIKPVATGLAGMFLTPAVAAGLGAAMGGLDREGKSGIGLDVGGAVKGGLSGYTMGKLGQFAGGKMGVEPMFAAKPAPPAPSPYADTGIATQPMTTPMANMSDAELMSAYSGAGVPAASTAGATGGGAAAGVGRLSDLFSAGGDRLRRLGRGALDFVQANPELSAGIAQGVAQGYGTSQEMGIQRQIMRQEEQRRRNLARLLMPLYNEYSRGF